MNPDDLQFEQMRVLAANITTEELHTILLGLICDKLGLTNDHITDGVANYVVEKAHIAQTLSMMNQEKGGYHA